MAQPFRKLRADSLTYLNDGALRDLFECVSDLEAGQTEKGVLIETGCALWRIDDPDRKREISGATLLRLRHLRHDPITLRRGRRRRPSAV